MGESQRCEAAGKGFQETQQPPVTSSSNDNITKSQRERESTEQSAAQQQVLRTLRNKEKRLRTEDSWEIVQQLVTNAWAWKISVLKSLELQREDLSQV